MNEGKLEALKTRFGDHTDAIFKRHNMKSIGYWTPEDTPPNDPAANGPSLFTAIEEQLRLKLVPATAPIGILVVTNSERPSEN